MKKMILALAVSFLGVACSNPKAEVDDALDVLRKSSPQVTGPKADGTWVSACHANPLGGLRKLALTIKGEKFGMKESLFGNSDTDCESAHSEKSEMGLIEWTSKRKDGAYIAKFKVPVSSNAYSFVHRAIKMDGTKLLISEIMFSHDDFEKADLGVALTKQSESKEEGSKPKGLNLASGTYSDTAGQGCDLGISTMKMNGVMAQVYVDMGYPCSDQITMSCDKGVCSTADYKIEVQTETSFVWTDFSSGKKANYKR